MTRRPHPVNGRVTTPRRSKPTQMSSVRSPAGRNTKLAWESGTAHPRPLSSAVTRSRSATRAASRGRIWSRASSAAKAAAWAGPLTLNGIRHWSTAAMISGSAMA